MEPLDNLNHNSKAVVVKTDVPSAAHRNKTSKQESPAELHRACQNFEEIFLTMILKEAKINQTGFEGDGAGQLYGDMMMESLAKVMAKDGGLGLAEMLYQQLSRNLLRDSTALSQAHAHDKTIKLMNKQDKISNEGSPLNSTPPELRSTK